MWYIVIMSCNLHWDSEFTNTYSSIVYAVDKHKALKLAEDEAFDFGYGAVGWHEVIECGLCKPKVVLVD